MNTQRIFGIVLVVVGIIALFMGMNASNSIADQVSNTFTGRFTQATTWYIVGGIGLTLLGLGLFFANRGGRLAQFASLRMKGPPS